MKVLDGVVDSDINENGYEAGNGIGKGVAIVVGDRVRSIALRFSRT